MTIEQMLEQRHSLKLVWNEPHRACGPEGNRLDAHVELRATVHDCINLQRELVRNLQGETMGNDDQHLLDFMANNFAQICPPETFS